LQIYVVLALGEFSNFKTCCRDLKVTLAIAGLAVVLLSIVSAAGFFGYLGVSCSMIIFQILPFLVSCLST
jgi:predicted RND superfamily exporter protein